MLDPDTEGALRRARPAPEPIRCRRPGCKSVYRGHARSEHELTQQARAAGWAIGEYRGAPDAMCPRCRRPDPELVRLCRELAKEVQP